MLFKIFIFLLLAFDITVIEAQMGRPVKARPKYRFKQVIVRGKPAEKNEIPYMVSLKERTYDTKDIHIYVWESFCGGSIIGLRKVLTAAHCFEGRSMRKRKKNLRVVAGELHNAVQHSLEPGINKSSQWMDIANMVTHRKYDFPHNDIALVFVEPAFSFSNAVSAVDIARRTMDYPTVCKAAGFGRIRRRNGLASPVLLVGAVVPMARSQCRKLWGESMRGFICSESSISEVARGDSGGPLTCRGTLDSAERPGKDLLVGVVSARSGDGTTLFTRVSAYADWIDRNLASKSTSCVLLVVLLLIV